MWLLASLYRWQKSWNKSWNKKPTFLTFIMVVSSLILTTKNLNTTLTVWVSSSTNSCTLNTPFSPIQSSKCRLLHRTSKDSPVLLNFSSHKNLHWKISNKRSKSARTSRHKSKTTKKYCTVTRWRRIKLTKKYVGLIKSQRPYIWAIEPNWGRKRRRGQKKGQMLTILCFFESAINWQGPEVREFIEIKFQHLQTKHCFFNCVSVVLFRIFLYLHGRTVQFAGAHKAFQWGINKYFGPGSYSDNPRLRWVPN